MICLSANKQGADLLLGYLGGTLDAAQRADVERHAEQCGECRGLLAVSTRLEEWAAPAVSPDFDERLYARIAQEAEKPWWRRLPWRPAIPVAAAAFVVVVLALFVAGPGTQETAPQAPPGNGIEIEQVDQALEDLELLMPLDAASTGPSSPGQTSGSQPSSGKI
ncbi:MAG: zf-HC2 domain-containing protein [Bryobacteraceae bacterium]